MFKYTKQLLLAALILASALQIKAGFFSFISYTAAKLLNTATKICSTYGAHYTQTKKRMSPLSQSFNQIAGYHQNSDEHKQKRSQAFVFSTQQKARNWGAFGLQVQLSQTLNNNR